MPEKLCTADFTFFCNCTFLYPFAAWRQIGSTQFSSSPRSGFHLNNVSRGGDLAILKTNSISHGKCMFGSIILSRTLTFSPDYLHLCGSDAFINGGDIKENSEPMKGKLFSILISIIIMTYYVIFLII